MQEFEVIYIYDQTTEVEAQVAWVEGGTYRLSRTLAGFRPYTSLTGFAIGYKYGDATMFTAPGSFIYGWSDLASKALNILSFSHGEQNSTN